MRIAYLTAGAAGMYCGSCMHDNALAAALTQAGVDCQLIPTYTPIRTDESDVSVDQVFFGGINVFLQQKLPLFRHLPNFLDRILDNPSLIRRVTRRASHIDPKELGGLTVSMLKGRAGFQRKEVKRLCRWLKTHVQPDVVMFSNILIGGCIPDIQRELGAKTVVTLQGDDIFLESIPDPFRSQALEEIHRLASSVDLFVTHSHFYKDFMSSYLRLPSDRVHVTPLAIDTRDFTGPSSKSRNIDAPSQGDATSQNDIVTLGYLARLAPEKGLHQLVDAFIQIHRRGLLPNCRLRIAGWLGDAQRGYAEEQFSRLKSESLEDHFEYIGSIDRHEKVNFLSSLHALCVPTTYRDPKGLFALEAMAAGVPVVLPAHGAFPELIEDTNGGVLFTPEDQNSLVETLETLLLNSHQRQSLGAAGREAVLNRRNASCMAQQTLALLTATLQATSSGSNLGT
jgi:glycosyltransferase involved in cell wall biosynthesis